MTDGTVGRPVPGEAQVGAARRDGRSRVRAAFDAGTMEVDLHVAKAIDEAVAGANDLGAEDALVEVIRARPVADGDDTVVEFHLARSPVWFAPLRLGSPASRQEFTLLARSVGRHRDLVPLLERRWVRV